MTISWQEIIIVLQAIILTWIAWDKRKVLRKKRHYKDKYLKELNIRKSSEVRLGKIGENLAPFTQHWPWPAGGFRFLGNPVDGIQFNEDEIVFVEIKTGKARLSKSQKNFKDLITEGKVRFATFRINENGSQLLMEESAD